jgi:DNA-binding transcriptional MerR regulator
VMSFVVPDACTLPTVGQPLRLAEFDALFTTAVRTVETVTPTHARMQLSGPAGLEATVRDLAARETVCCSFFTFTVTAQRPTAARCSPSTCRSRPSTPTCWPRSPAARQPCPSGVRGDRAPVLDLAELAAMVDVPVDTVHRYAETGLLPPAHRDGDQYGYPPTAAHNIRLLRGAERLGVDDAGLAAVAHAGRDGSCATARDRLGDVVATRLAAVESRLAEQLGRAAGQISGLPG